MTPAWTCSNCAVAVSYAPGHAVPDLPTGWTRHGGELRCLACGRAHAVAIALAEAGVDANAGKPATAIRRRALAEFELRRDPSRGDGEIAKGTGTTSAAVREARADLTPVAGAGERAEAELRRDSHRSNVEIARVARVGDQTVSRTRRRLEAAGEIPRRA